MSEADADLFVRDWIATTLRRILPTNKHSFIARLCEDVLCSIDGERRWSDLTEAERAETACAVGATAREFLELKFH